MENDDGAPNAWLAIAPVFEQVFHKIDRMRVRAADAATRARINEERMGAARVFAEFKQAFRLKPQEEATWESIEPVLSRSQKEAGWVSESEVNAWPRETVAKYRLAGYEKIHDALSAKFNPPAPAVVPDSDLWWNRIHPLLMQQIKTVDKAIETERDILTRAGLHRKREGVLTVWEVLEAEFRVKDA